MSREGEEEEEGEEREEADLLSADRLRRPAAGLDKRNSRYNQWNRHVINTLFYTLGKNIWKVNPFYNASFMARLKIFVEDTL
jgi:hypothetical protein